MGMYDVTVEDGKAILSKKSKAKHAPAAPVVELAVPDPGTVEVVEPEVSPEPETPKPGRKRADD